MASPPSPFRRVRTGLGLALVAAGVLVLSIVLAVSVGAVAIPPATVWRIALDHLAPGLSDLSRVLSEEMQGALHFVVGYDAAGHSAACCVCATRSTAAPRAFLIAA